MEFLLPELDEEMGLGVEEKQPSWRDEGTGSKAVV